MGVEEGRGPIRIYLDHSWTPVLTPFRRWSGGYLPAIWTMDRLTIDSCSLTVLQEDSFPFTAEHGSLACLSRWASKRGAVAAERETAVRIVGGRGSTMKRASSWRVGKSGGIREASQHTSASQRAPGGSFQLSSFRSLCRTHALSRTHGYDSIGTSRLLVLFRLVLSALHHVPGCGTHNNAVPSG